MTRLNYASRTSSGAELGNIVFRDLTDKFLKRPRSRVLHDPTIEINLSNSKRTEEGFVLGGLTDKGVDAFVQTLIVCLKSPHGFQLLELHLTGNKLTIKSLPALANIIELSADSLRDLDLSNNEIRVEVKEETELWTEFLDSFQKCSMLKRVNLGGNPLGSFGMEILARVYIQSPFAVQTDQDGNPRIKGLRSVPYLILSNINLTPSGIIHLASMLSIQQPRHKLRGFLPDSMPISTAREALGICESIIWLPNGSVGAEERDFFICAARKAVEPSLVESDTGEWCTLRSPDGNALSVLYRAMSRYQRRRDDEYFRYRQKICIEALNADGVKGCLLWKAALMTLKAGKILLIEWQCLMEQRASQLKTYAAAARGCPDSYDQDFPPLGFSDCSVHPDLQMLLNQLPSATRVHMQRGVSSLRYLFKIPRDRWYINIARAVRAVGLLTLDQHLRIMEFARTWNAVEFMEPKELAHFLSTVKCLVYH